MTQEERQARLREHARRLIAETRSRSINSDSPTSPIKAISQRFSMSPERTISPINNTDGFTFPNNKTSNSKENSPSKKQTRSPSPRITPLRDAENNHSNSPNHNAIFNETNGNSPSLQSFGAVLESLTPQREKKVTNLRPARTLGRTIYNLYNITMFYRSIKCRTLKVN